MSETRTKKLLDDALDLAKSCRRDDAFNNDVRLDEMLVKHIAELILACERVPAAMKVLRDIVDADDEALAELRELGMFPDGRMSELTERARAALAAEEVAR